MAINLVQGKQIATASWAINSISSSYAATASLAPNYTLTSSFNDFTQSYNQDSSSFDVRITNLEDFSSSLDATFATEVELNQATASLSSSIGYLSSSFLSFTSSCNQDSSSFDTRITTNSGSISSLSSSFTSFSSSYNTGSFTGSFTGDGSGLYNIPASGIIGLNLSQISSGSVSASISPDTGLQVNTNVTATSFTGSLFGTASFAVSSSFATQALSASFSVSSSRAVSSSFATTASFATTSSFITGSNVFGPFGSNSITSASFAVSSSQAQNAQTASFLNTLNQDLTFNGNLTLNGTASISTLVVNQTQYSSGSNQLGDGIEDTQTLFGTVRIPTGSLTVTGSITATQGITGSLFGTASWAENAQTSSYVNPLNQNILLSGSLKFDPTQDPDPTGLDLDSTTLFQSSSNTTLGYDLYIRQNGNVVKWKWIEGVLETGLLYGGVVTYSGSNVFVSPGSGIIAEHNATTGSEIGPIVTYVTWNAITQSISNIATQQVTYLYIDSNGDLQQQSSRFTAQQYHDYIPLGAVGHFDNNQVSAFGGAVQTAYDQVSQISSFVDAFGPLKISGYGLTGQAGTLQVSVGSGTSFIHGGFYENNPEYPSQITTPAQATASLARVYRSGSSIIFDTNGGNLYTTVNPTVYDRDGDGTLANVGNGNWSIQRVFTDPKTGVLYVYYGQERYTTLLNALQYLPTDPFTEGDTFDFTTFVGYLVLRGNASDLTDTSNNSVINGGLFRGSGQGSGGGIALSNLDDLTDVSINSPTNGQALIYDSGIWQNGIPTSASFALSSSQSQNSITASFATLSNTTTAVSGTTNYISKFTSGNTIGNSQIFESGSNVGIGTTTPTVPLHVNGASIIRGDINISGVGPDGDGANRLIIGGRTSQQASIQLFNAASGRIHINPWNNSGVYIAGGLTITGGFIFGGSLTMGNDQNINGFGNSYIRLYDGLTGNLLINATTISDGLSKIRFRTGTTSTDRLIIFGNGDVRIGGTTTPSAKLQIKGSGATSATTALRVENSDATPSMVVLDDGNVGIGTTTPGAKLDVNGNTVITGSLEVTNGITGSLFGTASFAQTASYAPNYIEKSVGPTYTTNAILTVTQAEYDAIDPKDPTTLYFII